MNIIAISGKAESGKSYTANIIKEVLEHKGYSVAIIPLAFYLKKEARQMGWNDEKDTKGRTFLQSLGKTMKAYHGMDYYAKKTISLAETLNYDFTIIDDLRLIEEVNALKGHNLITIRINRPYHENKLTPEQRKDISETGLDDYIFDYSFDNSGTEAFDKKIIEWADYNF